MPHTTGFKGEDLSLLDSEQFIIVTGLDVCSTHHTVLCSPPGVAVFEYDMLLDLPYLTGRSKIEHK